MPCSSSILSAGAASAARAGSGSTTTMARSATAIARARVGGEADRSRRIDDRERLAQIIEVHQIEFGRAAARARFGAAVADAGAVAARSLALGSRRWRTASLRQDRSFPRRPVRPARSLECRCRLPGGLGMRLPSSGLAKGAESQQAAGRSAIVQRRTARRKCKGRGNGGGGPWFRLDGSIDAPHARPDDRGRSAVVAVANAAQRLARSRDAHLARGDRRTMSGWSRPGSPSTPSSPSSRPLGAIVLAYGLIANPRRCCSTCSRWPRSCPARFATLIADQLIDVVSSSGARKGFGIAHRAGDFDLRRAQCGGRDHQGAQHRL